MSDSYRYQYWALMAALMSAPKTGAQATSNENQADKNSKEKRVVRQLTPLRRKAS
jgi:hypothetical protein